MTASKRTQANAIGGKTTGNLNVYVIDISIEIVIEFLAYILRDMDKMWEYNAPQYVDFTKRFDDDRADAYFGMNRSADRTLDPGRCCSYGTPYRVGLKCGATSVPCKMG